MQISRWIFIASAFFLALANVSYADQLPVFGYLEKVRVGPNALIMQAKLDTGADTTSLGYHKLEKFERDGKKWVKVWVRNFEGKSFSMTRKVIRISSIKRHGAEPIHRPVVMISMCLGGIHRLTQVSLADRRKFSTQVLVGRTFLAGTTLINSATKNTTTPNCKQGSRSFITAPSSTGR